MRPWRFLLLCLWNYDLFCRFDVAFRRRSRFLVRRFRNHRANCDDPRRNLTCDFYSWICWRASRGEANSRFVLLNEELVMMIVRSWLNGVLLWRESLLEADSFLRVLERNRCRECCRCLLRNEVECRELCNLLSPLCGQGFRRGGCKINYTNSTQLYSWGWIVKIIMIIWCSDIFVFIRFVGMNNKTPFW